MDFQKALEIKEKNKHLIGMDSPKGGTIDEILLVPTNEAQQKQFYQNYILNLDGDITIIPFTNADVDIIYVTDKDRITKQSIFFYGNILTLPDEYNVIIE